MPRVPLQSPEAIQRGGFQGGEFVQTEQRPQGGGLADLASALGNLNPALDRAMVTDHTTRIEQLRRSGADEASQIQATFQGYTAEQIGEALESEPLAARFQQNPYILPALQVHRGRVAADEMATSMVEAGINPNDAEAVSSFLQESGPDASDAFFSRGMNEQLDRYRAQWTQMQMRETLQQAEVERRAAAGREFQTVYEDTGDLGAAVESLRASQLGLRGTDVNDILVANMRAAAQRGDRDFVEALATLDRGDAPTMADDANLMDDVAAYREQADLRWRQNQNDEWVQTRTDLYDVIDVGVTRPALESDPRFESLPEPMQSMVVERWRSDRDSRRAEARRTYTAHWEASQRSMLTEQSLELLVSGRGEEIDDITVVDEETGDSVFMSRGQQIEAGVREFRSRYLGDNPLAIPAEEGERYRIYTQRLADGDLHDAMLQRYLDGLGAMMTPEAIMQTGDDVAQGYTMYSNMDPVTARRYVTDTRSRAVFSQMDDLIQRDPDLAPAEAAQRAVAVVSQERPRMSPTSSIVADAVSGLEIVDPLNTHRNWRFARRNNRVEAGDVEARGWIAERAYEYAAYMPQASALVQARADFETEHTVVNGRLLQLPNGTSSDPTVARETPERWARTATDFVTGLARREAVEDPEGIFISHFGGNSYSVSLPDGRVRYYTAEQMRRAAQTYQQTVSAEEAAATREEREAAAREAIDRRNRPRNNAATILSGLD